MNLGNYNIRKIKNSLSYNGNNIQMFDIQRKDNKMISRDDMMD